jgi:predicted TIM-barrel fold metal-dependent hydrolase
MIIDSHVHFGKSQWGNFTPEYLLKIISFSDSIAICSNLDGIDSPVFKNELECNQQMLEVSKRYHNIFPLFVCQPNNSEQTDITREFLEKYPQFIGLKLHPECLKLPADDEKYDKYLKLAREFKKPCLYHSGHIKSRFSSPKLIYKKAQEFPDVPIILGHLSTGPKDSHKEAINILIDSIENNKATLYVDTSWIDFAYEKLDESYQDTIMLINALKNTSKGDFTHRILWASDCPIGKFNQSKESYLKNIKIFKERVLETFNDKKLLNNIMFNNARNLYSL